MIREKLNQAFLFVCISGLKTDGHLYIKEAVKNGAAAVITEKEVPIIEGIAFVQVSDSRQAMPVIAANFFKHPSKELRVIGVTGTNGKTTVTHLIKAILEARGEKTAIIGTLYAKSGISKKSSGIRPRNLWKFRNLSA
jgi:UDP-N-acetylmuramoyl-L-alanyl-D-glutamate--2,6-diaminopimelate ligase